VAEGKAAPAQQVADECKQSYEIGDLDPIRTKVELRRRMADAPPPFAIASNDAYPTEIERRAIARWANLRDECLARQRALPRHAATATPLQVTVAERDWAFADEVAAKVSLLIVALYQEKMTYGEFAQKRYEFGRDGAAAEREYRQAVLGADQQLAIQQQQLAQQNFQNKLAAWSTYIQAVNARQPQSAIRVEQNVTIH
jgi:hypothetical protein